MAYSAVLQSRLERRVGCWSGDERERRVRLYYEIARRSFDRFVTYRAATLAGMATNVFFGLMRTYLFIGFYDQRGAISGWTQQDAMTFVWLGQALLMPIFLFGWFEIALTIRNGDIVSDLSKPFDYYGFWLARDVGRAFYHLLFRGIPTFLIGALLFSLTLSTNPGHWLAFLMSLVLAVWISFGIRFLANLAAFWFLDHRGTDPAACLRQQPALGASRPAQLLARLGGAGRPVAALRRHDSDTGRPRARQAQWS